MDKVEVKITVDFKEDCFIELLQKLLKVPKKFESKGKIINHELTWKSVDSDKEEG